MESRLALYILSSVLEELALLAGLLWGLPMLGVEVPLGGFIGMMVGLAVWNVIAWRIGFRALLRKPLIGLENMVGTKGKVVSRLYPEGLVKVSGELWQAASEGEEIGPGEEIIVVRQVRLKLIVRKAILKGESDKY